MARDGVEIDLLIERAGVLHPVEIKLSGSPGEADIAGVRSYQSRIKRLGRGAVLCLTQERYPINRDVDVLPISIIE